jgi:hypothetical protein
MDLITLALLGLGLTLAKGKKTADRLEFFPKNLELINGKLVATMEVLNPTNNALKVNSVFAGIFVDYLKDKDTGVKDKKIGNIERGEEITLAPNKRTTVKLPVKLVSIGAGTFLLDVIRGKIKNPSFKIVGIARALGIDNPIDQKLSFNG